MKVIKLSFLFLAVVRQIHSQFNNLFNSAYSSNLLKKKPNSISSFFFQNENSQARSVSPRNSRYNLNPSQQIQQPSNAFLQNAQQQRQQFGVNYSSPATRVQFTPTSQQQVTNSQFLTANDITSQNVPQSQNQIQYAQMNQNRAFGGIPSRGEVQIGSPQNFSQQIQNQNLQNKIKPQDLSLANQLSFDFNSTQAQQALLNQQLQQQAQAQQQIPQQQQQQPQQQIPQQQTLNQNQQTQQNSEPDLQALIQQLQNQQASQLIQQNQGQVQQSSNPGANNLDPEQQQLQLLLKQLSQNEQAQKPPQIKQETLSTELPEQSVPNKKRRPTPEELNQLKKKRKPPVQEEEDLLSQFFNDQSEGQLDEFFKPEEKPAPRPAKKRRPSTSDPNQNIDPPTSKKKSSSSSAGDINLFELFNNQGDSSQFGNSETQGEVVHYIDDPSQLNTNEPEVTSIDQFLQAGEIPGGGPGGMPF